MIPWILISLVPAGIILILLAVFLIKHRRNIVKPDYYVFFIMGIIWLPMGIIFDNYFFSIIGLVFMTIGLANRDKWKSNHRSFNDMKPKEKKFMLIMMIILGILVLFGVIAYLLVQKGIF